MLEQQITQIVREAVKAALEDWQPPPSATKEPPKNVQLLTVAEAAKILSLSKMTVYRMIEKEMIPVVRCFGCQRIDSRDLEAFIEKAKGSKCEH